MQKQLTAEFTARKTQYNYYRDKLLKAETNAHKYKLGEIAIVTKLAGFEFTNYVTYSENGNIIALRGLNVKNGRLDLHDVKYVDKSDFSKLERSKLHIGDMLFTYVGTVGQVAIVDEEDKYYLAPNVALIRCDKEVLLPHYMKYYFQTTQFWDKQIRRLLQSSSMQNIPMEKIRKFEITAPPLDVQNRIVNVLDNFEKICSDLNIGLPAEIEARQKQYEYYRDKLLTFAETGNTILSRAEQSRAEQSRALIKLVQYVYGCVWLELGDVIVSLNTGLNPRKFFKLNTEDATNYYITIREMKDGKIVPSEKTDRMNDEARKLCNNRSNLEVGDVLFSGTGTIGETAVIEKEPSNWNIKEGVYAIKPNQTMIQPMYLRYILITDFIKKEYMKKAAGGTVQSVPMGELKKIRIPVPSLQEQNRIVRVLKQLDDLCNDLTSGLPAEIEARQKQYEYYRDKLLSFKERL